jgi:large subunit ribosomal protein L31
MTGDLATRRPHEAGVNVKPEIHPTYGPTTVTCSCGNTFVTRSTAADGEIHTDVCSACHPFYTGKQKILDTGGRVARFERRFGKKAAGSKAADTTPADTTPADSSK